MLASAMIKGTPFSSLPELGIFHSCDLKLLHGYAPTRVPSKKNLRDSHCSQIPSCSPSAAVPRCQSAFPSAERSVIEGKLDHDFFMGMVLEKTASGMRLSADSCFSKRPHYEASSLHL